MEAPLVLIASYPKSGNTWVRAVIQGLLTPEHAGDINRIDIGLYGHSRRRVFDYYAAASAADMTPEEIELTLPSVYEDVAADARNLVFIKVHDRARRTPRGEWVFPPQAVRQVIYLVRHPFDVAASFSNHLGFSIEETVRIMSGERPNWFQAESMLPLSLQETDGSWSQNAESWLNPDIPYRVLCMRYEDMQRDELAAFRKIAEALSLPTDDRLQQAVEAAHINRLKASEVRGGFRERPTTSPSFFRQGGSMTWQGKLTEELRATLARENEAVMKMLGYGEDGTSAERALNPHSDQVNGRSRLQP